MTFHAGISVRRILFYKSIQITYHCIWHITFSYGHIWLSSPIAATNVTRTKSTRPKCPADKHMPLWCTFVSLLWHPTLAHLTAHTCQSPVTTWSILRVNLVTFCKYISVIIRTYNSVFHLEGFWDLVNWWNRFSIPTKEDNSQYSNATPILYYPSFFKTFQ
jgi:hypothetical protein